MKTQHNPALSFVAALLILFALLCGCNNDTDNGYSQELEFVTEDYKPLNYAENGNLTGLGPELLKEICRELRIPFASEILPWDQAYTKALTNDKAVLFSTVLNADRKELFKWAGPYASIEWMFYASSQNQIELSTLDDARTVSGIGVLADYSITQGVLLDWKFNGVSSGIWNSA
jgi:ABC-type amino acid transport substrate-binding protein